MISSDPQRPTPFQKVIETSRASGKLEAAQLKTAQSELDKLPAKEQLQALDVLEQTLADFGTAEAKTQYSLNPELPVSLLVNALPPKDVPAWCQKLLDKEPLLNLEEYKTLAPEQREQFMGLAHQALDYYAHKAESMRSGVNHASQSRDALADFIERASGAPLGS